MNTEFRKRMGLEGTDIVEARKRFLNRINISILRWLQGNKGRTFYDENFIWWISEQLGESWGDKVQAHDHGMSYRLGLTMEIMTKGDFHQTLLVIENAYKYLMEDRPGRIIDRYGFHRQEELISLYNFNQKMDRIMLLSDADLGVFWKDGKFYLSGAKELDEALVGDTLEWLNSYPITKNLFSVALKHYERALQDTSAGKDTITNCYTSIENLAREFLNNTANFDKNSDALVIKLGLPDEYKNIVHYYKKVANEYGSRHPGSNPKPKEVEAFVYLTGLLMRLITNPN